VQVPQRLSGGSDRQKSFIDIESSESDDDRSGSCSQSDEVVFLGGGNVGSIVPTKPTVHHDDSEESADTNGHKSKDKVTTPTIAPGSNASHVRDVPVMSAGGETATLAPDRASNLTMGSAAVAAGNVVRGSAAMAAGHNVMMSSAAVADADNVVTRSAEISAGNVLTSKAAVAAGSSTDYSNSCGANAGAAGEPTMPKPTSGVSGPSASDAVEAPLSKRERELNQWTTVAGTNTNRDRPRKQTEKGAEYRDAVNKKGGTTAAAAPITPKGSSTDAAAAGASPTSPSGKRYKAARSPTGAAPATAESATATAGSMSSSAPAQTSTPPAKSAYLKSGSGGGGGGGVRRDGGGGGGGERLKRAVSFSSGMTNTAKATGELNASTASTSVTTTVVPKSTDKDKTSKATTSKAPSPGSVGSGVGFRDSQ
jgi:hypothetical protein